MNKIEEGEFTLKELSDIKLNKMEKIMRHV